MNFTKDENLYQAPADVDTGYIWYSVYLTTVEKDSSLYRNSAVTLKVTGASMKRITEVLGAAVAALAQGAQSLDVFSPQVGFFFQHSQVLLEFFDSVVRMTKCHLEGITDARIPES